MENIELKIKGLCESKGWTLEEFRKKADISQTGYYKMIHANSMRVSTLEKISEVLGVSPSYFFNPSTKGDITTSIPSTKVLIQIELSPDQGESVLKMVMGKDLINLIK